MEQETSRSKLVEQEGRAEHGARVEPAEKKTTRVEQKITKVEEVGPKIPPSEQMTTTAKQISTNIELTRQLTTKVDQSGLEQRVQRG